jgi:hypothetical protein
MGGVLLADTTLGWCHAYARGHFFAALAATLERLCFDLSNRTVLVCRVSLASVFAFFLGFLFLT